MDDVNAGDMNIIGQGPSNFMVDKSQKMNLWYTSDLRNEQLTSQGTNDDHEFLNSNSSSQMLIYSSHQSLTVKDHKTFCDEPPKCFKSESTDPFSVELKDQNRGTALHTETCPDLNLSVALKSTGLTRSVRNYSDLTVALSASLANGNISLKWVDKQLIINHMMASTFQKQISLYYKVIARGIMKVISWRYPWSACKIVQNLQSRLQAVENMKSLKVDIEKQVENFLVYR
ncbi:hypothetical protein SUGI_0015110 [Cryptomeria japonica]|nr:hypothetical protein SUGI_0015110 [Cryptomeria japonica]